VNKKQLIVQLAVAAWISLAVVYEDNVRGGWDNVFAAVALDSIPALAFGFVLYRWFGRKD